MEVKFVRIDPKILNQRVLTKEIGIIELKLLDKTFILIDKELIQK